jgi:Holliday junction resolvasome RuvABC endonuclease subunit
MANVLSIDQSLSQSGYSVFVNDEYITSGTIKTKTDTDIIRRIGLIIKEIDKLVKEHAIDVIILELPVTRFIKVTRQLTSLWAILCWEYRNLDIINIHNKAVKRHCLIKGTRIQKKMGKINVMAYVNRQLGLDITNDNISDSLGLYLTWKNTLNKA